MDCQKHKHDQQEFTQLYRDFAPKVFTYLVVNENQDHLSDEDLDKAAGGKASRHVDKNNRH